MKLVWTMLVVVPMTAVAQPAEVPFLVAPAADGTVLRWVWPAGERPLGYHVERREAGAAWTRMSATPIVRGRDRDAARQRLGEAWARYEGLLFPTDPRDELRDPGTFQSLLLLAADVEPAVAEVLGLRFDDTRAARGTSYEYRLIALTRTGEREVARSGPTVAGAWEPGAGPDSLEAAQAEDGVALRWSVRGPFSAYHVYRRVPEGQWEQANPVPVVAFTADAPAATGAPRLFLDSAARAGGTIDYAVAGIDPFGRVTRLSAPVRVSVRDVRPPAPPRQVTTAAVGDTVTVTWIPSPDMDVVTYQVWRGDRRDGRFDPFGPRLPASASSIRDVVIGQTIGPWYYVTAVDTAGNESAPSFLAMAVVRDLTAPPAPVGVAGSADTTRLALRWAPVTAADLRGYRVYRASMPGGTFVMLTAQPVNEPRYEDVIRRGADHAFYYQVTAVDSAFNESPPSVTVAVRPPDLRPPVEPRIASVRPCEDCVVVRWFANPDPDVVAYRVRYRPLGAGEWRDRPPAAVPALVDTIPALEPPHRYEVVVLAVDDAGNESAPSPPVVGEPVHRRPPLALDLRRARWDARRGAVVIEWTAPAGVARVRVERRDRTSGAVTLVADVSAASTPWVDADVVGGRRYEYAVRAVDRFGNSAEPGNWRRVSVPEAGR